MSSDNQNESRPQADEARERPRFLGISLVREPVWRPPFSDEAMRRLITWLFDTTKYAGLAGVVWAAAKSSNSWWIYALALALSAALGLHIYNSTQGWVIIVSSTRLPRVLSIILSIVASVVFVVSTLFVFNKIFSLLVSVGVPH
jgi:hypothetical protein